MDNNSTLSYSYSSSFGLEIELPLFSLQTFPSLFAWSLQITNIKSFPNTIPIYKVLNENHCLIYCTRNQCISNGVNENELKLIGLILEKEDDELFESKGFYPVFDMNRKYCDSFVFHHQQEGFIQVEERIGMIPLLFQHQLLGYIFST